MRTVLLALILPTAVFVALAAGCSPLVGAECREGLFPCDGRCVDRASDPDHCGACGRVCPTRICVAGMCVGDAGLGDGGIDGGIGEAGVDADGGDGAMSGFDGGDGAMSGFDGGDGAMSDFDGGDGAMSDFDGGDGAITPGDGGTGDGGRVCGIGELECMGVCIDGLADPRNCGACGNACAGGEVCVDGVCLSSCSAPHRICDGRCVDTSRDPDNCGTCGTICGSGICIDGDCSEPVAGHVVVIGHDYVTSRRGMNRIAGNAVFLARGSPVRVLVWEGRSEVDSRLGTDAAIQQVAMALGRTWTRTAPMDPVEVPLLLATHDAFVIYAQAHEDDGTLRNYGFFWQVALAEFLARGGVVVLFETVSAANAGTWQILAEARLFNATGRVDTTGSVITVTEPADAVALRVPLSYAGERTTVRFMSSATTVVTRDATGPVVIHRIVVP
jgi:hypothetical protein